MKDPSLTGESKWLLRELPQARRHIGPEMIKDVDWSSHAVLAIGFKDNKNDRTRWKGWVLCQSSWGGKDNVEGAPRFWLLYSYVTDFTATADFWMMDFTSTLPKSKL